MKHGSAKEETKELLDKLTHDVTHVDHTVAATAGQKYTPFTPEEKTLATLCSLGAWRREGDRVMTHHDIPLAVISKIKEDMPQSVRTSLKLSYSYNQSRTSGRLIMNLENYKAMAMNHGFTEKLHVIDQTTTVDTWAAKHVKSIESDRFEPTTPEEKALELLATQLGDWKIRGQRASTVSCFTQHYIEGIKAVIPDAIQRELELEMRPAPKLETKPHHFEVPQRLILNAENFNKLASETGYYVRLQGTNQPGQSR